MTHTSTIEQRTLDWYRDRLGKITGSQVGTIFCKGRSKNDVFSKSALSYLTSVAAEQLLPDYIVNDDDSFSIYLDEVSSTSKSMRIGTEREPEARQLYAEITGNNVIECGCISHSSISDFASSPDGIVCSEEFQKIEGVIEIKCPQPSTYMDYLCNVNSSDDLKAINSDYYWQCMSHIAVTNTSWCDFIVYCPYNMANPIHIVRIYRDEEVLAQLYERLALAINHIRFLIKKVSSLNPRTTCIKSVT